jgi:NTE family protein
VASRVVAVFSGGGAKALAHLGAWQALREAGITPVHIVATSFGAVIGAALAAGRSPEEIASHFSEFTRKDVAAVDPLSLVKGFFAKSLLKDAPLRSTIARLAPARRFEDLKIPLTVTATDLDSGELALFGGLGPGASGLGLQDALYASCALPLYYPPAVIAGRRYADGGLRAVLPLEPAARIPADVVVAVSVGPGFDEVLLPSVRPSAVPPLVRAHGESERIMMAAQTERQIAAWGGEAKLMVVRAVAEKEATFRLEDAGRFMRAGYEATKAALGRA